MNILLKLKLIFISAAMICLSTPSLEAVIYKFVDENGSIHFVDDESKIPPKYLNETKKYKGKYDHLPEAEKRRRLAEEKRVSSAITSINCGVLNASSKSSMIKHEGIPSSPMYLKIFPMSCPIL